jgi:hypothetical protein
MQNLPEELTRLSFKELEKVLDTTNKYKIKYYWSGSYDVNYFKIYKLVNRFKKVYTFENLISGNIQTIDPTLLIPLKIVDVKQIKDNHLKNFINTCDNKIFRNYVNKLASDIFSKDRVDTIDNNLIIHFPEITITNSFDLSHVMRDIYIKFQFQINDSGTRYLRRLFFARTTLTDTEVVNNYQFSHLSSHNPGQYSSKFCFGDTALKDIVYFLCNNNISQLSTFLMSLESYLSWESLEGSPYGYLSNLTNIGKYKKVTNIERNYQPLALYTEILYKINSFDYIFELSNGRYIVKLSPESIKYLEEYLTVNYPIWNNFLINEESYEINNEYDSNYNKWNGEDSEVTFKGEIQKINIIKTFAEDEVIPPMRIHRTILNNLITNIENAFNEQFIKLQLEEEI